MDSDKRQEDNRKTSVDQLNDQLYYEKSEPRTRLRRKIHSSNPPLDREFPEDDFNQWKQSRPSFKLPSSFFKKMFFLVLIFFLASLVVVGISLSRGSGSVSDELISMEILGQPFVDGGEDLELQVRIQNFNEQALELPDLVLSYPKDSREGGEMKFLRRSLEDIPQGQRVSESFDLILFGQEGDVRTIEASLEYRIAGSNAIFVRETNFDIIIRSTPSTVTVNAPTELVRDQIIELQVELASNSNTFVSNTLLDIDYPDGFEFISADPEPYAFNNIWNIPLLNNEKKIISISGRLSAFEGQGQTFKINFGKQDQQQLRQIETLFNTLVYTVDVKKPFITSNILINGSSEERVLIRGGSNISGIINITNTLDVSLEDVVVELYLAGNLYPQNALEAEDGFFDSSRNKVIWDKNTFEELSILRPYESKNLFFNLPSIPLISEKSSILDPQMNLYIDISGFETNGNKRTIQRASESAIVANSDLNILTQVSHQEGPFDNYGPMPPRVNASTSYTITLSLTNSSNNIESSKLIFNLPVYVSWKNNVNPSSQKNSINYDASSREVTWNTGLLEAGLGFGSRSSKEISFQLELKPSSSQLGDLVELTGDILLQGKDSFTGADLSFRKRAIENRLSESQEPGADGRVSN